MRGDSEGWRFRWACSAADGMRLVAVMEENIREFLGKKTGPIAQRSQIPERSCKLKLAVSNDGS